jgi:hypothetical protein
MTAKKRKYPAADLRRLKPSDWQQLRLTGIAVTRDGRIVQTLASVKGQR